MASHDACSHPRTKAARAACRRGRPQPKLKRRPDMEAGGAKVYEVVDDVVGRNAKGRNGSTALDGALAILRDPTDHPADEVARARQYLYGS
jgi:hypothetical protein